MLVGVIIGPFFCGIIIQSNKRPSALGFIAFPLCLSQCTVHCEEPAPGSASVLESPTFFLCMILLWHIVGVKGGEGECRWNSEYGGAILDLTGLPSNVKNR